MRCRKVRSCLSTYCRGELPADRAVEIKNHLAGCNSCRREAEAIMSVTRLVREMPSMKTSSDFSARLMQRIAAEGSEPVTREVHLPGRIPRFNRMRLATVAATAVIILAVMFGVNYSGSGLNPTAPMATINDNGGDLYLTVQPTSNPLLNEHKSVTDAVKQYNRFRELSRQVRSTSMDQFQGVAGNAMMVSSQSSPLYQGNFQIRPVNRNYMIVPVNRTAARGSDTY